MRKKNGVLKNIIMNIVTPSTKSKVSKKITLTSFAKANGFGMGSPFNFRLSSNNSEDKLISSRNKPWKDLNMKKSRQPSTQTIKTL